MRYDQNHLRKLNNGNNNTHSAAMNKHPETIIRGHMISSVAVIRHTDGSMLKVQHMTGLSSVLKEKYFVLSPSDVIAQSSYQRLHVLTSQNLTQLKMREDVNVENADDITHNLPNDTLMTVCVDDLTLSDLKNHTSVLSHLFIGPNTSDTSSMQEYQLKNIGLSVFAGPLTRAETKTHYPVSVSLIDPIFHPQIINESEINLLENAVGSRAPIHQGALLPVRAVLVILKERKGSTIRIITNRGARNE